MHKNVKAKKLMLRNSFMHTSQPHSFGKVIIALRNALNYAWLTNSPELELNCDGWKL